MKRWRRTILVSVMLLTMTLGACGDASDPTTMQRVELVDANGVTVIAVDAWVADTFEALVDGLRRYPTLGEHEGLLMVFPSETQVCITNAGVPYPIDIAYVSASRQVIAVETLGADERGPICHPGTAWVLEVRGDALSGTRPEALRLP